MNQTESKIKISVCIIIIIIHYSILSLLLFFTQNYNNSFKLEKYIY